LINKKDNYLEWIQLVEELDEAKDHLDRLTKEMSETDNYNENRFSVDLGHVYAHLNRAWNSRCSEQGILEEDWNELSKFPKDIKPVG